LSVYARLGLPSVFIGRRGDRVVESDRVHVDSFRERRHSSPLLAPDNLCIFLRCLPSTTNLPQRRGSFDDALLRACLRSHGFLVDALLSLVVVREQHGGMLEHALFRSIEDGACTAAIAGALIRSGADPNTQMRPLLHLACSRNNLGVVRALLDAGSKTDALDAYRVTPLELAERLGFPEIAAELMRRTIQTQSDASAVAAADAAAARTALTAHRQAEPGPRPPEIVGAIDEREAEAKFRCLALRGMP
jgi:hypothetical protein